MTSSQVKAEGLASVSARRASWTRRRVVAAGGGLAGATLAACGASGATDGGTGVPLGGRKATVTWLYWGTQEFADVLVQTQDAFMKRYPNMTIDRQYIADSNALLEKL